MSTVVLYFACLATAIAAIISDHPVQSAIYILVSALYICTAHLAAAIERSRR